MYRVMTCGFAAAPLRDLPTHGTVGQLPHPTDPGFVDYVVDNLPLDDPPETTLLLHDGLPATESRVRMLRSLLGTPRFLPLGIRRPLSSLSATATVLATLAACRLEPGAVIGSLPLLVGHIQVRARSRSVSRLDFEEVRISHQLATMVPGTMVSLRFADRITVGGSASALVPVSGPTALVQAGEARLARRLGPPPPGIVELVEVTGAPQLTKDWWGTGKYVEQCLVPLDLSGLISRVKTFPWRRCPECDDPMSNYCRFCAAQEVYA